MYKEIALIITFSCFTICQLFSQDIDAFNKKVEEQTNFADIMSVVRAEYKKLPKEIQENGGEGYLKQKHWERWAYFMSSRLGENGEFVNISKKNLEAIEATKKMESNKKSTITQWGDFGPKTSSLTPSLAAGAQDCTLNGIGRVDRIAFHPTNQNIIYIGMPAGGLWKTTNRGATWSPLTDFLPSVGISGIVVSHANPNRIYILTGDGDSFLTQFDRTSAGVFISNDGGETWTSGGPLASVSYAGFELVQDPNNANILLAATTNGIYKTTDAGLTWSRIRNFITYDLAFKPGSSQTIYAARPTTVLRSTNGGDSWSAVSFSPSDPPQGRKALAVTPANPNVLYVLCGNQAVNAGTFGGLYKSTNSGQTLFLVRNTPNIIGFDEDGSGATNQQNYDLCMAVNPSGESQIVTGGILIWRSSNSGTSIQLSGSGCESNPLPTVHPDIHALEFNPLNGELYAATDGGIYRSLDNGINWSFIHNNISVSMIYHMDKYADNNNTNFSIGLQDNGIKYKYNPGTDYVHILGADGFYTAIDETDPSRLYTTQNARLYVQNNFGDNFVQLPIPNGDFFKTVENGNTDFNMVLCSGQTMFRSTNGGNTWSNTGVNAFRSIASCPSNNSRFYTTGSNQNANRSDDNGVSWISITNGLPTANIPYTDIEPRPNLSSQVWMTCGGFADGQKVYFSSNAGSTWQNRSGSLPNVPVHSVAVTSNNGAYVGTDIGVFYRPPNVNDWIPLSNSLPRVPVTDIKLDEPLNQMFASTYGRGVWQAGLPNESQPCRMTISINGELIGYKYYEASDQITSRIISEGSVQNTTFLKSGNNITFEPGAHLKTNSFLRAYIGDCQDGGVPLKANQLSSNQIEKGEDSKFNRSYLEISGPVDNLKIDAVIKKKSGYSLQLLDENRNFKETIETVRLGLGKNEITNIDLSNKVETMVYLTLIDDSGVSVDLQEIHVKHAKR